MDIRVALAFGILLASVQSGTWAQDMARPPAAITHDTGREVAAVIGPTGGRLDLTAADGSTYRLEVPPGALLSAETIQMRPIIAVTGLPGKPTIAGGVSFEPKGLEFLRDAMLTITPGTPLAADRVPMLWGFVGEGRAPTPVPHRIEGASFLRPIDHFSGQILAGEWWRHVEEPNYQKELDAAVRAGEDEAQRIFQDTVEQVQARRDAMRLRAELAREMAMARACQLSGKADCNLDGDKIRRLAEQTDKGVVKPALRALGQPGATCEQAVAAVRLLLGSEREWQLLGVRGGTEDSTPSVGMEIEVEVDGERVTMEVTERVFQLCRRKAVETCRTTANISGMVVAVLAAERQRQLLGRSSLTPEKALQEVIDFLKCTEPMAELCHKTGDYMPLMELAQALAITRDFINTSGEEAGLAVLEAGKKTIETHLKACARYRISWKHVSTDSGLAPALAISERVTHGAHSVDISYMPAGEETALGRIVGEGAANFTECSARLLKSTEFLSLTAISSCAPAGPFRAELIGMRLRRAARPATVELRAEIPAAVVRERQCWEYAGCSEYDNPAAGGLLSFLLFQMARHPAYGVMSGWQIVRNLKEPMNSPYPVLFRGGFHLSISPPEQQGRVFDDRAEIMIEHIGQ